MTTDQNEPEFNPFDAVGFSFEDEDPTPDAAPEVAEADVSAETVEPEPSSGPERDEHGRFKPKEAKEEAQPEAIAPEAEPAKEQVDPPQEEIGAPTRFSADAKVEWDKTPLAVRKETQRAVQEMEAGIERYRRQVEPLRPYIERAEKSGTTIDQALAAYVGLEDMLRQDPIRGLNTIAQNMGTDLRTIASKVLGQPAPERDQVIDGLRNELAQIKQQVSGVHKTTQDHSQRMMQQQVAEWAASKPRFDELTSAARYSIQEFVQKGYPLDEAYELADRFNPVPQQQAQQPAPPAPTAQTRNKATLSISGAPATGSNPRASLPSSENNEDIKAIIGQFL